MTETGGRLLVVDDDVPNLHALCDTLELQGFTTRGCQSGAEALAALAGESFDLVVTDLHMAGLNGLELLEAAHRLDPDLVGIVMTGAATAEAAVDAMRSGTVDFLLKPLKLRTALPVLQRALQIRRLRAENARLQRQVHAQLAQLEFANRELEAFAYSVSHDLRAPLHVIEGFSSVLESRHAAQLDKPGLHYLQRIRAGAANMHELVDGMLRLSQVGRSPLVLETVDMCQVAGAAAEEVRASNSVPPGRIHIDDGLPPTTGDRVLLRQLYANLLSNACKFSAAAADARVEAGSCEMNGRTAYFVRDNGTGFDTAQASRLFQPFQRFHSAQEFAGIGIGLSLAQRIVTRHGGRIWAESAPGAGACFYFTLAGEPAKEGS